ncbi:hypothetical protein CLOM_g10189 [Closterium sp. NIES-68]|nr:hypothetical protein CLOM_g10189 [Closterium sp. NIES-68]
MTSPSNHVSFGSSTGGSGSLGILGGGNSNLGLLSPVNEQRLVAGVSAILGSQWSRRLLLLAVLFFAWLTFVLSSFLMLPRVHTLQAIQRNRLRRENNGHRVSGLFGTKGTASFMHEGSKGYSKLHDTVIHGNAIGNNGIIASSDATGRGSVTGSNRGIDERGNGYSSQKGTEGGFAAVSESSSKELTRSGSTSDTSSSSSSSGSSSSSSSGGSSSSGSNDSSSNETGEGPTEDVTDVIDSNERRSKEDGDLSSSGSNESSGVDRSSSSSNGIGDVKVDQEQLKQELLQDGAVEDDEVAGIPDLTADLDESEWAKTSTGNGDRMTDSTSAGAETGVGETTGSRTSSSRSSSTAGSSSSSSSGSSGSSGISSSGISSNGSYTQGSSFFPGGQSQHQQQHTPVTVSGSLDNTDSDFPLDAAAAGAAASLADEENEEEGGEGGEGGEEEAEGDGDGDLEDDDMDLSYESEDELEVVLLLRIPRNMAELRAVRATLALYKREFPLRVVVIFVNLYLFLQSFCIPGTICMNLLAGSLFGFFPGLLTISVLITTGACASYTISHFLLRDIVYYYFPDKCDWMRTEVQRHYTSLIYYVISLRITPIMPTWVVNLCSPLVGIPIRIYLIGTFFGFIPSSVIQVKAGCVLSTINSLSDLYDAPTIAALFLVAILALLPPLSKTLWAQRLWAQIMSNSTAAAVVLFISSLGVSNSGVGRVSYAPLRPHYSGIGSHSMSGGGGSGGGGGGGVVVVAVAAAAVSVSAAAAWGFSWMGWKRG